MELLYTSVYKVPGLLMYLSGMTAKLIFLHSETFDLSGTRVSENDQGNVSSQVAKDMESSVCPNVSEESEMNRNTVPVVVRSDVEAQPDDISIGNQREVENIYFGFDDIDSQGQIKGISDVEELKASQQEPLGEITEMEIERGDVEAADAVNCSVNGLESSPIAPVSGDICNMTADLAVQPVLMDENNDASASRLMDVSCMSSDEKLDAQTVERDASVLDISYGKAVDAIEIVEHDAGISIHVQSDCLKPADDVKASLASECNNIAFENGNQPLEETRNDEAGFVNELPADLVCDEKDPTSSFMCSGETNVDSTHSVEHDLDVNNASLNGKENRDCQEADLQSIMDGEIPFLDHSSVEDRKVSCRPFFPSSSEITFKLPLLGCLV